MRSNARIEFRKRKDKRSYGNVISFQVGYWPPEGNKKKWITIANPDGSAAPFNFHEDNKHGIEAAEEYLRDVYMPRLRQAIWLEGVQGFYNEVYGKRPTVGEVHDEMIEEYNANHVQNLYLRSIAQDKPIWSIRVSKLTQYDCEQWLQSFPDDLSTSAFKAYKHRLGQVLKHARGMRYMDHNPLQDVTVKRGVKQGPDKENFLTEEELDQLMATPAPSPWTFNLFCFMHNTSCGPADLMKFKYSDVVERNGERIVDTSRQKNGGDWLFTFADLEPLLPKRVDDYMWTAEYTGANVDRKKQAQHVQHKITRPFNEELEQWCRTAGLMRNGQPHVVKSRALRRRFFTQVYSENGHDSLAAARAGGQSNDKQTRKYIRAGQQNQLDNARIAAQALTTSMQKNGVQPARI